MDLNCHYQLIRDKLKYHESLKTLTLGLRDKYKEGFARVLYLERKLKEAEENLHSSLQQVDALKRGEKKLI